MEFKQTIELLKERLGNDLPGIDCQYKMAASDRTGKIKIPTADKPKTDAAILILFFEKNNKPYTLLIKRPIYNGTHSGQVAFPGGKVEEIDRTIFETALREANEEVGVNPSDIEIIGKLTPLHIPVSNIMVYPIIGKIDYSPNTQIQNEEVEYVFEVDFEEFLKPEKVKFKTIELNNRKIDAPYFDINNEFIWGATAMIINELVCILN